MEIIYFYMSMRDLYQANACVQRESHLQQAWLLNVTPTNQFAPYLSLFLKRILIDIFNVYTEYIYKHNSPMERNEKRQGI